MKPCRQIIPFLCICIMCVIGMCCVCETQAAAGTVTSYEKITWGISTGRYEVNGIHAFCAEYSKSWPPVGATIDTIQLSKNDVLRKALYYGYNGPKNTLGTDAKAHVLTAIAISDANIGERETGASATYDEFYWDIVNNPSKYPSPPSTFKAYIAVTSSTSQQDLAFYQVVKNGYVKGEKTSSDTAITKGNSCYSLDGAKYGIYEDKKLSEKVGTLTMNSKGKSNTLELEPGTYYAAETKAPKGYALSDAVTKFTVTSEETMTLKFEDDPQVNPITILLKKVDAETGLHKPQGQGSLKGARFSVKYYAGLWKDGIDPQNEGASPTRQWIFETDEEGIVRYEDSYKVSGDKLYEAMPLGTITIQEIQASPWYLLNDTVYVEQITESGDKTIVKTYQAPVVPETLFRAKTYALSIRKSDDYGNVLCGAEFSLYSDQDCANLVTSGVTDETGELLFENLEVGKIYWLRETKVPAGYENQEEQIYEIYTRALSTEDDFIYYLNQEEQRTVAATEERVVSLEVNNKVGYVLPNTGTVSSALMLLSGVTMCIRSIWFKRKNTKKRRR